MLKVHFSTSLCFLLSLRAIKGFPSLLSRFFKLRSCAQDMSVRQHLDERSLSQIAAPAVLTAFIIHELFAQDHTLEPFIQRSSTSCEVHGLFVRLQVGAGRTKREDLKIQRQKCSACSCHFIIQSSDWLQEENIHSWKSCLFFICDVNVSNCNSLNSSLQLAATDL